MQCGTVLKPWAWDRASWLGSCLARTPQDPTCAMHACPMPPQHPGSSMLFMAILFPLPVLCHACWCLKPLPAGHCSVLVPPACGTLLSACAPCLPLCNAPAQIPSVDCKCVNARLDRMSMCFLASQLQANAPGNLDVPSIDTCLRVCA